MSAIEAARGVARGEVSPVELAEAALRRIEAWQPVTNAFSQVRPEATLEEARAIADRVARGKDLPLAGVPLAVKDLFDVAGWETSGCCAAFRGRIAATDAGAVRVLREAGAVVVGKTNQHELAAGATNLVSSCGATRNPWDPSRLTGGSSGGSGAAVASRCVPLALGTDTGGSIRIPASFCGVTGVKPTHGRVPMAGVMPLAPSLDTAGPLAGDARDGALAFAILAGEDPSYPEVESADELRVGVVGDDPATAALPDVLEAVDRMAESLPGRSLRLPPGVLGSYRLEDWDRLGWREFFEAHGRLLETPELLGGPTRTALERGRDTPPEELEEARRRVARLQDDLLATFRQVDALLLPATPFPAPGIEDLEIEVEGRSLGIRTGAISRITRFANLAGIPGVALPVGFSDAGLPLGAQLLGPPGGEAVVLRLAIEWQGQTGFHLEEPPEATVRA